MEGIEAWIAGRSEQFQTFWEIVVKVWHEGVFGIDIGRLLIALGIFLIFYFMRGLFMRFVLATARRYTKRTASTLDDQLLDTISQPLKFVFIILGVYFGTSYLELKGAVETVSDNVTESLIVVAIFWVIYNAIIPLSALLYRLESVLTREMVDWLVTGIRWGVLLLGAATILQLWGIQVAPLVAGLGLFGVAVALGAQDLFKNLIGGISILIERRFSVGDWIRVDGVVEGTVERISFRSTLIRRFDKAPVYVPNQQLSDGAVINFSNMTFRRISWTIGLEYRTSLEQLKYIRNEIEDYLRSDNAFVQPPRAPLFVRIDSFGASSIDLMIYCFTRTTVWGEWLEIKEAFAYRIKEIVEQEAGAGFAFPSQQVYVETLPPMPDEIAASREPRLLPGDKSGASDTSATALSHQAGACGPSGEGENGS